MTAADSSVIVAAFASWHESHAQAADALSDDASVPAHAALEAYSVLTRLPAPHRVEPEPVREFLVDRFAERYLVLDAGGYRALVD